MNISAGSDTSYLEKSALMLLEQGGIACPIAFVPNAPVVSFSCEVWVRPNWDVQKRTIVDEMLKQAAWKMNHFSNKCIV